MSRARRKMGSFITKLVSVLDCISPPLRESLATKPLFIAMDRDGTLVPLSPDPDAAVVQPDIRTLINELALLPDTIAAIVSARGLIKLSSDFGNEKLILAGNYGLEISFPGGRELVQAEAENARETLQQVKRAILERLSIDATKVILEDHVFSLCAHWHLTPVEERGSVHAIFKTLEEEFSTLRFHPLPTSYEVLPRISWDKGRALQAIADASGISLQSYVCVYLGDSQADEPAFQWVNQHGGLSVKVEVDGINSPTAAGCRMPEPVNVIDFVRTIINERKNHAIRTQGA